MSDVVFQVSEGDLGLRESHALRVLRKGYTLAAARVALVPLIQQSGPVSLRTLDWCCTNWSKQCNAVCPDASCAMTNIHHSYRNMLGYWKRRLFDPFRRRNRIVVTVGGVDYHTTLGQANFALWTYTSGVLEYTVRYAAEINRQMNHVSFVQKQRRKDARQRGCRHRRTELTPSPKLTCVAYVTVSGVSFDS